MNRKMRRKLLRNAYDVLGRRWRDHRRSQEMAASLGLPWKDGLVGRRPPFSVFCLMVPSDNSPMMTVEQSTPREFLEYALEFIVPPREKGGAGISWRGAFPRESAKGEPPVTPTEDDSSNGPIDQA